MSNSTEQGAPQEISIGDVMADTIKVNVNGEIQEIKNGFEELKSLLLKLNAADFKSGDKIYNIGSITNATFSAEIGKKNFNMFLTRKLTESIRTYSPDAESFLASIRDADKENWETQSRYTRKANSCIISSFVGVLGIMLRKLIASGQDSASGNNYKDYLDVSIATSLRTLQLLCFAFISSLWDHSKQQQLTLSGNQLDALDNFFSTNVEYNIMDYVGLLGVLIKAFNEQKLAHPFSEIAAIEQEFEEGGKFRLTCKNLQAICDKLDSGQYTLTTAFEAETELTAFLVSLNFLASYKMVSVKDIAYEEVRNNDVRYLHAYTFLGVDNNSNMYAEKFKYDSNPISTDAIMLYKDKYQQGLNLFPFIIDFNALTNELEAKICFYTYIEENKKKIGYADINKISSDKNEDSNKINDASEIQIIFNEEIEKDMSSSEDSDITRFKTDAKRFSEMRLNIVYQTFLKAKTKLLS